MFNVVIQADDKTWFVAHKGEKLSACAADKMIAELRNQGFNARAVFAD